MNIGLGSLRETLKKIFRQFHLEIADALGRDLRLHDAIGPAAEIDCGGCERFVHGHQEIARSQNAELGAKRFLYGFTERDADVFDGVMLVHIQIAVGVHIQIKCAMPRNQLEHVIEKADSRRDARFSVAIQVQL